MTSAALTPGPFGLALGRRLAWATGFVESGGPEPLSADEVAIALREGLAPLLGHRLRGGAAIVEREEDREVLSRQLLGAVAQEIVHAALLGEIGERFGARGLPFLCLKAAALRGRALPEGTRPATDVDLLVAPARFAEAIAALRGAGFAVHGAPRRALTVSLYHERCLKRGDVAVDLHRSLSAWPLFAASAEELLAEAEPAPGGGLVPLPAALLVTLAAHAAQHGFQVPLRSIVDGLAVVRELRPDPARVVELARRWSVVRGTAVFVACLRALGLAGEAWAMAMRELGGDLPVETWAGRLLLSLDADPGATLRRERWWRARLVDARWRTVAFYGYRGMLLFGDVALRAAPRSWRAHLEGVDGSA